MTLKFERVNKKISMIRHIILFYSFILFAFFSSISFAKTFEEKAQEIFANVMQYPEKRRDKYENFKRNDEHTERRRVCDHEGGCDILAADVAIGYMMRSLTLYPFMAAALNDSDMIQHLINDCQVDPNIKAIEADNATPLHFACAHGHADMTALLIKNPNININKMAEHGVTPLQLAIIGEHEEVIKILINTGRIDCDANTLNGRNTLQLANNSNNKNIIKLIYQLVQQEGHDLVLVESPQEHHNSMRRFVIGTGCGVLAVGAAYMVSRWILGE